MENVNINRQKHGKTLSIQTFFDKMTLFVCKREQKVTNQTYEE